ncbi:MAG: TetR/AcrR family transcriptional regulator [Flavobacteriales bacterium]|nr:TetR/AcrR family transcriptional regulator [Flavobacteriales bacterium]
MKDKILQKSADMFLNLGFKSVTMDDIAANLGMSKKTIYSHFSSKKKLVEASTFFVSEKVNETICSIIDAKYDPIEETFTIKSMINNLLKNEKSSPSYQLQKYYPKIFKQVNDQQFEVLKSCIVENLKRGIVGGYYRKDIDIDLITRFYFSGNISLTNQDLFPMDKYEMSSLKDTYLDYHIRAIATEKGLRTLKNILKK